MRDVLTVVLVCLLMLCIFGWCAHSADKAARDYFDSLDNER